ncbi:MAG TPA: non-heme iron oxygenase ferredoxin subunit [Thermomicrobiales bacterium]|jgi:nitrite reductase/ring-hydroxylating ferredoxin subunit|nr:non-heme iron oxygenase ferredoxin subunit [Thermomicrobiales bacterium]
MAEKTFQTVARVGDIGPGEMKYVEVGEDEEPIVLINFNGEFYALSDICTHEEASLADGEIIGDEIECPLHGGAFEIRTGLPAAFPVVVPAKMYDVRVVGDEVQIAADE